MPDKQLQKTARSYLKNEEFEKAAELFEKAGDFEGSIDAFVRAKNFVRAAELSISIGRGDEAVNYYKQDGRYDLIGDYYSARKEYLQAGQFYTRSGNHARAAEVYELVIRKFPELKDLPGHLIDRPEEELRAYRLAASAQSRSGNFLRAAALYHKINAFDEEAKNLIAAKDYLAAGDAYERNGLFAEAGQTYAQGEHFFRAAQCFEKDGSHRLAADNYIKCEEFLKAGNLYSLASDPFASADAFHKADHIDLAIKILTSVDRKSNGYIDAINRVISLSYEKQYLTPPAKRMLGEMIMGDLDSSLLPIYIKIAQLFEISEFSDEAKTLFTRLNAIDSKSVAVFMDDITSDQPERLDVHGLDHILKEDFDAEKREFEYKKRIEIIESAKNQPVEADQTLSGGSDTLRGDMQRRQPLPGFMHIQEGQKFGDRYLILKHLGSGGMGSVYKAKDLELEETVAIKILSPQLNLDENAVARFKQEIKLARQINHPNVIRIFDLGEIFGIRFITMEYFPGEQIKKILAENGFFSLPSGLKLIIKVSDGIIAAHKQGIIHRDIKSQNILMSTDGVVKVLDFGIAKSTEIPALTIDGSILGTPEYISPEAVLQKPVDIRSDIYSLGIVMFEIFTGNVPFTSDTVMGVIRQHLYDDPPIPSSLNPEIPEEIDEVILKCMEREPANRFQSVAELMSELKMLNLAYGDDGTAIRETTKLP